MAETNMLDYIYNTLISDGYIKEQAGGRIKFYEYPETGDVSGPFIIIDSIDAPRPTLYADDTWLMYNYLFQIDVWTLDRKLTRKISKRIQEVLWEIGLRQTGSGVDEYDNDSGIFREARRYEGNFDKTKYY